MRTLEYSLKLNASENLRLGGYERGADVHLNGCCYFHLWRRTNEVAAESAGPCPNCLETMRQIVADAGKAWRFFEDGGEAESTVIIILQPQRNLAQSVVDRLPGNTREEN